MDIWRWWERAGAIPPPWHAPRSWAGIGAVVEALRTVAANPISN